VGASPLRVCRAANVNGWHPGKEWAGKCNIGYGGKEVAEGVYQLLQLGFDKVGWQVAHGTTVTIQPTNTGGEVIYTGPTGTPTPPNNTINFNTTAPPVVVGTASRDMTYGFWMRSKPFETCYGARTNSYVPGTASTVVGPGTKFGELYMLAGLQTCFDDPRSWLVRQDAYVSPSGMLWFRLKLFEGNLCLQPENGATQSPVVFAPCNNSQVQWWGVLPGGYVVSGISITTGVISLNQDPGMGTLHIAREDGTTALHMIGYEVGTAVVSQKSRHAFVIEQAARWQYKPDRYGRILP
jgi:hypothetical protein